MGTDTEDDVFFIILIYYLLLTSYNMHGSKGMQHSITVADILVCNIRRYNIRGQEVSACNLKYLYSAVCKRILYI